MPLVFGDRSLGTGLREFYEAALLVGCKLFILFDTEHWEEQLKQLKFQNTKQKRIPRSRRNWMAGGWSLNC